MCKKGYKHTEESRKKMSEAHKNISDETRAKMSESRKGVKKTPEHRAKISESHKGKKHTVKSRAKMSEVWKGKRCGENNPSWKGGISFEPYCILFNDDFKERTRDFYGYKCVECGKNEEENGRKHCVHHVNYHKDACCNDVKPLFVILCTSCHAKTNHNREYWEEHFTNMINIQYNGQCYLPKIEV